MKVFLARNIGFCDGVKRSINITLDQLNLAKGKVYTEGPLVHNMAVINKLLKIGVHILKAGMYLHSNDIVVIRAHGIPHDRHLELQSMGCLVKDATCPKVLRIAGLIRKYSNLGYNIIFIGDAAHPEVIGLRSYSQKAQIHVISSINEFYTLKPLSGQIIVLCQTTLNIERFIEIVDKIHKIYPNAIIKNTICPSTKDRQSEVLELINKGCDLIVVVGSKNSKNSNELIDIALKHETEAIIIESQLDITLKDIATHNLIGVCSGASTDIQDVINVHKKILSLIPK